MGLDFKFVDEITDEIAFYVDKEDHHMVYAEYAKPSGAEWFTPIEHEDFCSYLRMRYREVSNSDEEIDVKAVIRFIHDVANYDECLDEVETFNRVAGNLHTGIEYYLANRAQQVVHISNGEWEVNDKKQCKFITGSRTAQVIPVKSDRNLKDLVKPYVNLVGDSFLLFLVWLIQCFSCETHYGLMISAEPGSGKSSLTRFVGYLVDPGRAELSLMPKKDDDLKTDLANRYLACYDNNSGFSKETSDVLCTAITGGTVNKRALYTDKSMVRLRLKNVILINGIGIFPEEADLAERFLMLQMKKITEDSMISEYDLWAEFEKDRPEILGCIFDILAEATETVKHVKLAKKPRLASAFVEMIAIAEVLGMSQEEFRRIYDSSIKAMQKICSEKDIVAAVREYMDGPLAGSQKTTGFSSELYAKIAANYSGDKKNLPSNASHFSRKLNTEKAALKAAGFEIDIDNTGSKGSVMTIRRIKR